MSDGLAELIVLCLCCCFNDPLPPSGFCRPCSCCNPNRQRASQEAISAQDESGRRARPTAQQSDLSWPSNRDAEAQAARPTTVQPSTGPIMSSSDPRGELSS
ncbi:hypothetical protein GYMLUDRAFT_89030 [Collybiopsis luxurians FD-317 M1]|uniref:Unplaced genomic scaffold GYMLUscaffold_116, whole genome shotgun sequence n=1 Tax=Collybiopsis luxurians FD-317 M1 TaxID=944289 RepID=A0A0D0BP92_9AGAR|nr:hypothetical protein GYMLUDRAFT_89030 [Collybiopsis luxurians FD-317 M1]